MREHTGKYKTLVFDCDGVVLNSNRVKTEAFYKAALPYGEQAANALVEYHIANGGISRYKKFAHFLQSLIPLHAPETVGPGLEQLLASYADKVSQGLLTCDIAPGLQQLRKETLESRWLIVSGGDQTELRDVFAQRDMAYLFDGGIFGSPDTKEQILARELKSGNICQPALFLGDSKYDHQAATASGIDFVFLTNWTEVKEWGSWLAKNKIASIIGVSSLVEG